MNMTFSFRNRTCWCGETVDIEVSSGKQNQTRVMFKWIAFQSLDMYWYQVHVLLTFFQGYRQTENTWGRAWCSFDMLSLCPIMMLQARPWVPASNHVCAPLKIPPSAPWKDLPHHSSEPATWAWFPPPNPHELRCCRRYRPVASPAAARILWPSWRSGPLPRRRNL